jgi:hypothetical protein
MVKKNLVYAVFGRAPTWLRCWSRSLQDEATNRGSSTLQENGSSSCQKRCSPAAVFDTTPPAPDPYKIDSIYSLTIYFQTQ